MCKAQKYALYDNMQVDHCCGWFHHTASFSCDTYNLSQNYNSLLNANSCNKLALYNYNRECSLRVKVSNYNVMMVL